MRSSSSVTVNVTDRIRSPNSFELRVRNLFFGTDICCRSLQLRLSKQDLQQVCAMLCITAAEGELLRAGIGFQAVAFGIDYERRVVVLAVVGAQARLTVVPAAVLERSGVERIDISAVRPLEAEMQSRFGVGRHRMLHCQDPELRTLYAVIDIPRALSHTLVAQWLERGVIETARLRQIFHSKRYVTQDGRYLLRDGLFLTSMEVSATAI